MSASPTKGDIIFYSLLAALVVVLVVIGILYTKSKKFKLKEEIKFQLENKEYEPPIIVKIEQKQVKKIDDVDGFQ